MLFAPGFPLCLGKHPAPKGEKIGFLCTGLCTCDVVGEIGHQRQFKRANQAPGGEMLERQRFASESNTLPSDRRLDDKGAIREAQPFTDIDTRGDAGSTQPVGPARPVACLRSPLRVKQRKTS